MAEMILVNKKVIRDPMFTPVQQWLTRRIAQLEIDGDPTELALAKERYESLIAGDLVIEDVKTFADGIQRVCIVSRKTGFARADIEFERVPMKDILNDFAIPFVNILDIDALKEFSKTNAEPAVLLWLEYKNTYGVLLTQDAATTIDGVESAFGDLFFTNYQTDREDLGWIDYDTIESGTVTITDPSIGAVKYPLFIQELVLNEANLPIITSNLPVFITTSRGAAIDIPNTYWFGGTLDITQTAEVEITTGAGYTVPRRSDDKLSIVGKTIFGSSSEPVVDQIIVRVTHQYNGRPVRRTFRIEVRIDKDTEYDLVIRVEPETIRAARGDEVQVVAYASFRGADITLVAPPAKFESPKGYGDLIYVETQPNGGMVYNGKITGIPPMGLEVDKDLYTADFNHDDGSTPYTAPGFINFELIRAEDKPVFRIASLTTTLRGYINDVKQMEIKAFFGDDPVPASSLGIQPGPRGDTYQLVRFDSAVAEAVNYTVIRDSQKPGEDIEDEFEQKFTYTDSYGVRHSLFRTIKIVVSKVSVIEIVPVNVPREVTRYQRGGPLFKVMVNGLDKTGEAQQMKMVWTSEWDKFLSWENGQWLIKYSDDVVNTIPVTFSWKQPYDGANHDLTFEGSFVVKVWDPNTNPGGDGGGENPGGGGGDQGGGGNNDDDDVNTEVVVFPMYWGIDGLSDERGEVYFRVYSDGVEITKTARRDTARTVMPPELRDEGVRYDQATGMLVWTYYKLAECDAKVAKLFYTDPKDGDQANLPSNRRGRMYITANVKQSRILKLVEQDTSNPVWLDDTADVKLAISFAGEPISLKDLTFTRKTAPGIRPRVVTLVETGDDFLKYTYTTLEGPNATLTAPMIYELSYTDPVTGELQKLDVTLNVIIKMPPLEITQADNGVVNARMWDTGPLIFKAMMGTHDLTSLMSYYSTGEQDRYVKFSGRTWSIGNAPSEDYSKLYNVPMRYTINADYRELMTTVPKTFNIEGWDGIEFRHTLTPLDVAGDSGDTGEIRGGFQYRWDDVTNGIRLDRSRSVIPNNIEVQDPVFDPVSGEAVIRYTLKRGYKYPMKLVFLHPTLTASVDANFTVDVKWAPGLNLESTQSTLSGYHTDVLDFALKYNFSGTVVTNENLNITFSAQPAASTSLVEILGDKVRVSLDQGGAKNTVYNCQVTLDVEYTDPETSQVYSDQVIIPTEIKVPDVVIGSNPTMTVKVYDRGDFKVTLKDTRGKTIPYTNMVSSGTNNFVQFVAPKSYYVTKGDTEQTTLTDVALVLTYTIGGNQYDIDVTVPFQIVKFDGIDFTAKAVQTKLEGNMYDKTVADFVFTYKGDVIHGVRLSNQSVIPANLIVGTLENSQLPYTFKGQGTDSAKFRFVREGAGTPAVEGKDFADVVLPVVSKSSDEAFTIISHGDDVEMGYGLTKELPISVKYGDYVLDANAPGLKYTIKEGGDGSVSVLTATKTGITLQGVLASTPGTARGYLDQIVVSYDVGAATPKTETFAFTVRIRTPIPVITNNDPRTHNIWERGTFGQSVNFNDSGTGSAIGPVSRVRIVTQKDPDPYVEMWTAFNYEIMGAPTTTQALAIPLRLVYTLNTINGAEEFTADFDTTITIIGYARETFHVEYAPTASEGIIGEYREIRMRPVYQGQPANMNVATPRWDLVTYPAQLGVIDPATDWKRDTNDGQWWILRVLGVDSGVGDLVIPWEYQESASESPSPDLLKFDVKVEARIMGEPGIEIGQRESEVIPGSHTLTGNYHLQVLFGGVPVDVEKRIADGTMTMTVKPYTADDANAGAMSITATQSDTFDYLFTGPVAPGRTVLTKEIILLTYKYGGQTYNGLAEIPVSYTSGPITIPGDLTQTVLATEMFVSKPVLIMSYMCDDFNLGVEFRTKGTISNAGTQSKYIKYKGQSYSAEWAELTASTQTVSTTFASTNKGWTWSVTEDVPFKLPAWDQKTYRVEESTNKFTFDLFVGESSNILFRERFRDGPWGYPGDFINPDETDLGGLLTLEYTSSQQSGYRVFKATGITPGTINTTLVFDRFIGLTDYPYQNPKEYDKDYTWMQVAFNVKVRPLTISNATALTAGNNDVRASGNITITLGSKTIQVGDTANLKITALDPNVLTIEERLTGSLKYRVQLPLGTTLGTVFPAKFKYEYTDPGTGWVHEGTQTVNVTYANPDDYPVMTKLKTGGEATLWAKFGPIVKMTSSGVDVTNTIYDWQNDPSQTQSELAETLLPFNGANKDWIQVIKGSGSSAYLNQGWKFKVPFRDTFAEFATRIDWHTSFVPTNPPQMAGTVKTIPIFLTPGQTGQLEFNLTYRGDKINTPVFNDTLSDLKGLIRIDSMERKDDTMSILVNYTVLAEGNGTPMVFTWDKADVEVPSLPHSRVNINVTNSPGLKVILPETPPVWEIWKTYNPPFQVVSGTTDLLIASKATAINDPYIVIQSASVNGAKPIYRVDNSTKEDTIRKVKFSLLINQGLFVNVPLDVEVDINFKAWNGIQFEAYMPAGIPLHDDGKPIISIGRGINKVFSGFTSKIWNASNPNGTAGSANSSFDQGLINIQNFVKWNAGGANASSFTVTITGVKNGFAAGKLAVDYTWPANAPNGFTPGTEGKNRHTWDVYFEVFEPELTWVGGLPPAEVVMDASTTAGNPGNVVRQMTFGRDVVDWTTATITVRTVDTNIAYKGVNAGDVQADRFALRNRYINKYEDLHTTIQITATVKIGTPTYTMTWDQKVLLLGAGATNPVLTLENPRPVSTKVWERGDMPFDIKLDGADLPAGWTVKQITVADSAYVSMAVPMADTDPKQWLVSAGDTTKEVITDPTFTVVVGDDAHSFTKTITVRFTIEQYDGKEITWRIHPSNLTQLTWWPDSVVVFNDSVASNATIQMWVKGVPIAANTFTASQREISDYYTGAWTQALGAVTLKLTPKYPAVKTQAEPETKLWRIYKTGGPGNAGGVEGIDFIEVNLPSLGYSNQTFHVIEADEAIEGQLGDVVPWNCRFRLGLTESTWAASNNNLPSLYSLTPANVIKLDSYFANGKGLNFAFVGPIANEEVVTDVIVNGKAINVVGSNVISTVKVTQRTTIEKPTIENTGNINAVVSQKGKVPFIVMHNDVDVTNDITNIVVTGGKYVEQTEFNTGPAEVWEVVKSEVAGVTAPVKFTFDVIVEGVKFSMEQSINFVIAPFNDAKLTIVPATSTTTVGIGKPGSIRMNGSWGSNPLANNVELDLDNSELSTLITVEGVTPNADGTITVSYIGGPAMAEGDVKLRFKVKNGNSVPVEGYDWVDVTFGIEVMLLELVAVLPFEDQGEGTQYATALLSKQQVSYNGVTLDNTDPDMRISMSVGSRVGVATIYPDAISYRFLETILAELVHHVSVNFEYKGVAKLTVPLTLTQKTVEGNPTVVEIQSVETQDGKTNGLPFKVLSGLDGRDISPTGIIKSIVLNNKTEYFNLNGDDTYTVIYKNAVDNISGTARFTVTVTDAEFETELTVEVPMVILKYTGKSLELKGNQGPGITRFTGNTGKVFVETYYLYNNGLKVPVADWDRDTAHENFGTTGVTITSVVNHADGFGKTVTYTTTNAVPDIGLVNSNTMAFKYLPTAGDTPDVGKTYVIQGVWFYLTRPGTTLVRSLDSTENNQLAAIGDIFYINVYAIYDGEIVSLKDPRFSGWALVNGPTGNINTMLDILEITDTAIVIKAKATTKLSSQDAVNYYATYKWNGVAPANNNNLYFAIQVFPAKVPASKVEATEYIAPAANSTGELVFTVEQPVYDNWVDPDWTWNKVPGPNWKMDGALFFGGTLLLKNKSTGAVIQTVEMKGLKRDGVGRYRVPMITGHVPATIEVGSPLVINTSSKLPPVDTQPRSRVPVTFVTQNLPGAPVLAVIDENEINTSTERTTSVAFKLRQVRKSGIYQFLSTFSYESIEGPATYVANGITDPVTHEQFIQLKGTGEKGDVKVHGTITDEDGVVYPVTLNLIAKDPSQVEFILATNEVDGYHGQVIELDAAATYQGANLPLNNAGVTIGSEAADWLSIDHVTADKIFVKVLREVTTDETFKTNITLTAYGETHKQEITVNVSAAVPPLEISGYRTITAGNGDEGSTILTLAYNGTNVPVNDPGVTLTVPSDFEIIEQTASGFQFRITTPLNELGPKTVRVSVEYEAAPGVISKGEYNQDLVLIQPSDYPRISANPTFALNLYLYKMTPPTATVMSGTVDISGLCFPTISDNRWLMNVPEEERKDHEWFWVIDGWLSTAADGSATQEFSYKLTCPFRDTFVDIDVTQKFYWSAGNPYTVKNTWDVTYTPTPVAWAAGSEGEIEFTPNWAGRNTTDITLALPTIAGVTWGETRVADGKMVVPYTVGSSTVPPVGGIVFTFTHNRVNDLVRFYNTAKSVEFKLKNDIVLTFTGATTFAGGVGDARFGVPYTCTNNGKTFSLIQEGVTITTVPSDVISYGGVSGGNMWFTFNKKVDEVTLDRVQVFVNFEGDKSNGPELAINTSPRFVVDPLSASSLTYQYHTNQYLPITCVAWYGTQRVPNNSPDIKFSRASTLFDSAGDLLLVAITHTGVGSNVSTVNQPIVITHVPSGSSKSPTLVTNITGSTSTSAKALSSNQAIANETKQLQFQIQVAAAVVNLGTISYLKLTNVPPEGNAILTQGPMSFPLADKKTIGTNVTTGWTGNGVNIAGFVESTDSAYKGWWKIDTTFMNVAQAEIKGTTKAKEYDPTTGDVTILFKLEQQQGSSLVPVTATGFGEIVTSGEIASTGGIVASGDTNYPYEAVITPTGNVGAGTLKGLARVNGIEQAYTVYVSMNTPRLILTTTVGTDAANAVEVRTMNPTKFPFTLMYGETLLRNDDPNVEWSITVGTASGQNNITPGLRRQFASATDVWFAGITHSVGVAGVNTITAKLIDDNTKTSSVQMHIKFVANQEPDWTVQFWTVQAPIANADTKWLGTIGVAEGSSYALGASYKHFVEAIGPKAPFEPMISVPSNQAPDDDSIQSGRRFDMRTGWTGGDITMQGVICIPAGGVEVWYNILPRVVTIPQEKLNPINITNEVGDEPAEILFGLTQIRGINGGPIVDMSTIPGITFKTITFDSAIVASVTTPVQGEDGNFSMTVTRKAGDKTNVPVNISMVVTVEGVDYLTLVPVKFTVPTPLVAIDGTETTGRGNEQNPVTLTQSVYLPN